MGEDRLTGKLGDIVGRGHVLGGGSAGSGEAAERRVVVPADACETAAVVALAVAEGRPVVVLGGGTGLWAGAAGGRGAVVISTARMAAGPEIHADDLYAVVGAGVVAGELRRCAEAAGLLYPIDPASEAASTMGGNIAGGAAGMHGLKYGAMRNYVLGLEMVTPEGRVIRVGGRTVKNVAGYDITRLAVGSRGALGIVTSAIVKLLPLPRERRVIAFGFADGAGAADAAGRILAAGVNAAALEILDEASLAAAVSYVGDGVLPRSGALLLAEVDGARSRCEAEAAELKATAMQVRGAAACGDATYPAAGTMWAVRRSALAALASTSAGVRLWDLRLAPGRMPDLLEQIKAVSQRYGVGLAAFGHAGEGRLHLAAAGDWADAEAAGRVDFAVYRLASLAAPLGVVISEGGGIGSGAWPASDPGYGQTEAEVVGRLKEAFDPMGLMSPGIMPGSEGAEAADRARGRNGAEGARGADEGGV